MKIIDRILYRRSSDLERTNYEPADDKGRKIFEHALLYMKKGKQRKVFSKTYFTNHQTTAEELESVIYYGSVVGDANYRKKGKTGYYDRYLNITIRNQLCKYLKHRIDWEQNHIIIDFNNPENNMTEEPCCIVPACLDISDFKFIGLTDREIQAVIYYAYGFDDDYVADMLNLSINTVRTFRRRGLEKMRRINNYQKLLDLSQPIMEN